MTRTLEKTDMQMAWFFKRLREDMQAMPREKVKALAKLLGMTPARLGAISQRTKFEVVIMLLNALGKNVYDYMPANPKVYPDEWFRD